MLSPREELRRTAYFQSIASAFPMVPRPSCLVITHLLFDRPFFLRGLANVATVSAVLPKPKSTDPEIRSLLETEFVIDDLDRDRFSNSDSAIAYVKTRVANERFAILDIGGYFATPLASIAKEFGAQFLGVVEDTENGYQKYARLASLPCPVISVARSPLKNPEDYLVGQSVVFSIEALLRENGDIPIGRRACVIGYGKIGRSVALLLRAKGVQVVVHDSDPVRQTEALSHGFAVYSSLSSGLRGAGLVIGATGNLSLRRGDFEGVDNGAYIATVTSSDDELDMAGLREEYREQDFSHVITKYSMDGHYFFLLNRGNAVNFIHGANVGPFIFLVQSEIIAGLNALAVSGLSPGLHEVTPEARQTIARLWLEKFNPGGVA